MIEMCFLKLIWQKMDQLLDHLQHFIFFLHEHKRVFLVPQIPSLSIALPDENNKQVAGQKKGMFKISVPSQSI